MTVQCDLGVESSMPVCQAPGSKHMVAVNSSESKAQPRGSQDQVTQRVGQRVLLAANGMVIAS